MTLLFRSSTRVHRLLIAAGVVVPALLFAGAVWKSRIDVLRAGEATALNAVATVGDSIRAQLQAQELTLALVADHFHGLDWAAISTPDSSKYLGGLSASLDHTAAIWIADRDGIVRAASVPWQPGSRIAEHGFFDVDHNGDTWLSATFTRDSARVASLSVIQRRAGPDGRFDGTIHAVLDPTALARLLAEAAPGAHDVLLVRPDGKVLDEAGPHTGVQQLGAGNQVLAHILAQPVGGAFLAPSIFGGQGDELYSYRQVPDYPVWVSIVVDQASILRNWVAGVKLYGAAAAAGSLALLLASWGAIRKARAEQDAVRRLHDETERRLHAEQCMRESHRLEAVAQLAGGIAHDFNNLLTVVMGSLDLIRTEAGRNDRIRFLADQATRAAERGARLTSSLLAFARRQIIQTDTLDANRIIRDFLPVMQQGVGTTIRLELNLHPDLPPCRADAAQLEAALLNVAINARDAMQDGGTLTIATRPAELTQDELAGNAEAAPGAFIAVSLTDTGSGMPQEVVAKAFEPFFTTKPVGRASGLGLSQVFGFVRQLGGHVTIESTPGRGSVATLFLPQA